MSDHLSEALKRDYPFYRPTWSQTQKRQTWANNCIHCGKLQGEWHNHQDFDGAFCPDPFEGPCFPIELREFDLELSYHILAELGSLDNDVIIMAERALRNQKTVKSEDSSEASVRRTFFDRYGVFNFCKKRLLELFFQIKQNVLRVCSYAFKRKKI